MLPPYHENSILANTQSCWAPFDTQERWEINMKDIPTKKLLTRLGYHDPYAISYSYNSHGFRDVEFDTRQCGIAVGCSFTHGTGLSVEHTWPNVLSTLLGYHVWNLGVGGTSLDSIFRISEYYFDLLRPNFVALLIPPNTRFEYFAQDRYHIATVHDSNPQDFFKHWFSNQQNRDIQQQKNLLALEKLCVDRQIKFVTLCPLNDWTTKNTRARDLAHPDAHSNKTLAQQFLHLLNQ